LSLHDLFNTFYRVWQAQMMEMAMENPAWLLFQMLVINKIGLISIQANFSNIQAIFRMR